MYDADGVITKYESVLDILKDFFKIRLEMYEKRKRFKEGLLAAECVKYDNIVRFISEKIDGTVVVGNKIWRITFYDLKPLITFCSRQRRAICTVQHQVSLIEELVRCIYIQRNAQHFTMLAFCNVNILYLLIREQEESWSCASFNQERLWLGSCTSLEKSTAKPTGMFD